MEENIDTLLIEHDEWRQQVYRGKKIGGLTIDEDQGILYVSDLAEERIVSVLYERQDLETKTIYAGLKGLSDVTSLAVDFLGNIFWAVNQDGKDEGAIMRARADEPNSTEAVAVTKTLKSASSLCYRNELLYFSGANSTDAQKAEISS